MKLERSEFSSNFEFDRNMLSGTGAWSWSRVNSDSCIVRDCVVFIGIHAVFKSPTKVNIISAKGTDKEHVVYIASSMKFLLGWLIRTGCHLSDDVSSISQTDLPFDQFFFQVPPGRKCQRRTLLNSAGMVTSVLWSLIAQKVTHRSYAAWDLVSWCCSVRWFLYTVMPFGCTWSKHRRLS